nr:MAG TPA: hypothetical protein [Caudoviricetes sp.]
MSSVSENINPANSKQFKQPEQRAFWIIYWRVYRKIILQVNKRNKIFIPLEYLSSRKI